MLQYGGQTRIAAQPLALGANGAVTSMAAVQQAAQAVVNQATYQNNQGISNLSGGKVINIYPVPESINVAVISAAGDSAAGILVNLFNTNKFGNLVTNNGSGANSITYSYGDGTATGLTYDQYWLTSNQAQGLPVFGFNIGYTVGGTSSQQSISTANLSYNVFNGAAGIVPVPLQIGRANRNTQYIGGLLTVAWMAQVNALAQFKVFVPVNSELTFELFTSPFTV